MKESKNWIKNAKIDKHIPVPECGTGRDQLTVVDFVKYTMKEGDSVLCETAAQAFYLSKVIGRDAHKYYLGLTRQEQNGTRVWKVRREPAQRKAYYVNA